MSRFFESELSKVQVQVTNTHSRTVAYGEVVLLGGYVGTVAEHDGIANAEVGNLSINPDRLIQSPQVAAGDLPTVGAMVYLAEDTGATPGTLQATGGTGTIYVGRATKVGTTSGEEFIEFKPTYQNGAGVLTT